MYLKPQPRQSNPDITEFMSRLNITGDYSKLESLYISKLLEIVSSFKTNNGYIVWQEVFDNGVTVKNDTIIHVWKVCSRQLKNVDDLFF